MLGDSVLSLLAFTHALGQVSMGSCWWVSKRKNLMQRLSCIRDVLNDEKNWLLEYQKARLEKGRFCVQRAFPTQPQAAEVQLPTCEYECRSNAIPNVVTVRAYSSTQVNGCSCIVKTARWPRYYQVPIDMSTQFKFKLDNAWNCYGHCIRPRWNDFATRCIYAGFWDEINSNLEIGAESHHFRKSKRYQVVGTIDENR